MDGIYRASYSVNYASHDGRSESKVIVMADQAINFISSGYDNNETPASNVLLAIGAGRFTTNPVTLRGFHFELSGDDAIIFPDNITLEGCSFSVDASTHALHAAHSHIGWTHTESNNVTIITEDEVSDLITLGYDDNQTPADNILSAIEEERFPTFPIVLQEFNFELPSNTSFCFPDTISLIGSSFSAYTLVGDMDEEMDSSQELDEQIITYGPSSDMQFEYDQFENDSLISDIGAEIIRAVEYTPVKQTLMSLSANWADSFEEIETFKDYFLIKMWDTSEAENNPRDFAQKQLYLLDRMNNDPDLRAACLDLAIAGSSDCHDNAFAMFVKMQEKVLEIVMCKPGVSKENLLSYGVALENQAQLEHLINYIPELKRGVNGGEGVEAKLALQLLCYEKNIPLPIPVTSMINEETGWEQFKGPEDGPIDVIIIKEYIGEILDSGIPPRVLPSSEFLSTQPFWQNYVNRQNLAISQTVATINECARVKLDIEDNKLFDGGAADYNQIEANMKAIEQERINAIARLYFDETERLLRN